MAENKTLLRKLQDQRLEAVSAAREIADRAASGEELSAEDNESYTRANTQIDHFGGMIKDEVKRETDERSMSEAIQAAKEKGRIKAGPSIAAGGKTIGERMRDDLTASRGGETRNGGVYGQLPTEQRALEIKTATKGPELVPVTLVESLYQKLFDDSAVLSAGPTILRTESGETMKLPRLATLGALTQTNARVAEAGTIQESEPTFDQVTLDAYKYAQFTQVSRELVEDAVIDIEALIGNVLGRNISNYVGLDLTTGAGTTGLPRGVRTIAALNKVDSAAGGLFPTTDFDKFFDVIAKLKPPYRRNGKWLVNDQAMFSLRKAKMNGVYAWEPNLQGGAQPDKFLGYPVLPDPNVPVPAASAGVTAIFADFSAYYVRLVRDVRVEWSMEYAWISDRLAVKAVLRADGDAIDDAAIAGFNSTA